MLPEVQLDRENFEEILEDARGMISSVYPEWTNYNYSDPGITILELFSYFKEIQQFHLDQVGEEHKRKFAKLLGIHQQGPDPARMLALVRSESPFLLEKGTRCYCKGLCFETERSLWLPGGSVSRLQAEFMCNGHWERSVLEKEQLEAEGRFRFYPFGKEPKPKARCEITLENSIEAGKSCRIYVQIYEEYEVRRNDMTGPLPYPLAVIAAECESEDGWTEAKILDDSTYGLLKSGWMEIAIPKKSKKLRLILMQEEYDVAPVITAVGIHYIELVQKDSCICAQEIQIESAGSSKTSEKNQDCNCEVFALEGELYRPILSMETGEKFLLVLCHEDWKSRSHVGWGTGFPRQQFELKTGEMILGPVGLLVSDVMEPEKYRKWTQVEDFGGSGPEDLHYVVDRERGMLIFGDGVHGMAPEGDIRLIHLELTKGAEGNIKTGTVRTDISLPNGSEIVGVQDGRGGRGVERALAMYGRLERVFMEEKRAVSGEDICRLVKCAPGLMVKSCKLMEPEAFEDEQTVGVVVRPYSEKGIGRLSDAYRKNLLAFLEPGRLIGTRLEIRSPEYIGLRVYVEVRASHRYPNASGLVEDTVRRFFKEQEDAFGKPIIRGRLYGCIDSLDAVEEISMLTLEARGNRVLRNAGGDLFLPSYGVCLLERAECRVVNG